MKRSSESIAGIISFVLSIIPILLVLLSVVFVSGQGGWMLGLFLFLAGMIFEVAALILGVIGILQSTKGRVTAFLGTSISTAYSICLLYLALT